MNHKTFSYVLNAIGYGEEVTSRFRHIELPFELMPHQIEGFRQALSKQRFGLFFEPRTGKTIVLQLLAIFYAYYGVGTIQIMPPGLFRQFMADYIKIKHHGLIVEVLAEGPQARANRFSEWRMGKNKPHVVLLSKEIFKKSRDNLIQLGYSNLHFDECHKGLQGGVGTRTTKGSETARAIKGFILGNKDRRLVLSTGTPIPTDVQKAYTLVSILAPDAYQSQEAFNMIHCNYKKIYVPGLTGPRQIQVVDSYKNLGVLNKAIYQSAIYAAQRDVLDLEAPNIQIVEVQLSSSHRSLYRTVVKDLLVELPDGTILDVRKPQKRRQVALQLIMTPGRYSKSVKHSSVFNTLTALTDGVDIARNKVVIFANYNSSITSIVEHYALLKPAVVYGPNGPQRNAEEVERFRNTNCQLLVANPDAGGVGFKLGDVCTTVIFAEPTGSPGMFKQALSRVLLKGQTKPVVCYILKVVDTFSPIAIESMLSRTLDIQKIMNDERSLLDALLGKQRILLDKAYRMAETEYTEEELAA